MKAGPVASASRPPARRQAGFTTRTAGPDRTADEPPGSLTYGDRVPDQRRGTIYGVLAYLCWGLFPLYWPLLEPANALEILSHRVVWSLVFVVAVLAAR